MSEDDMTSESEHSSAPTSKEVYEIAFKSIRTKGDIPLARSNFSLTRLNKTRLFLFGGCNEEQDFNDAYFLDLVLMRWTQVDIGMKLPRVGHVSACLYRGLNVSRPYVYIFGGWDGAGYSDKGLLINPTTLDVLVSNYNDPVMEWSNASKGSYTYSGGSNSSSISNNFGNLGSLVARTPNARLESNTANRKNNSGTFPSPRPSNAKSITWIASVRGDKGKTETSIKKLFTEKIPFSRRDHTLTFDPESQKLYLYGGWNSINWAYDESKFLEIWSLDSNWRWTKENIKGDIPISRRGHTAVYLPKQRSIIIYGGCSGSNAILGDCYEYLIETGLFTKITMKEAGIWPAGRAWHSAELIGHIIYYYGGLVTDFTTTKEVIAFDTYDYEWRLVNCLSHEDILDIERFGHSTFSLDQSILVLGGTVYEHEDKDNENLSSGSLLERKISLADLLVIEILDNDDVRTFEKSLNQAIKEAMNIQSQTTLLSKERNSEEEHQPPPIPSQFMNPLKLLEDQANFLHWNPHIFPSEVNKTKIQYFKKKIEEETINRNNLPQYPEFEGLGDEESSFSLASIKHQTSEALSDHQEKKQSNP